MFEDESACSQYSPSIKVRTHGHPSVFAQGCQTNSAQMGATVQLPAELVLEIRDGMPYALAAVINPDASVVYEWIRRPEVLIVPTLEVPRSQPGLPVAHARPVNSIPAGNQLDIDGLLQSLSVGLSEVQKLAIEMKHGKKADVHIAEDGCTEVIELAPHRVMVIGSENLLNGAPRYSVIAV